MTKILIIDDEERIRRILSLLLRERGYEVTEAGSAEDGLEIHRTLQPDLVLLDLRLPGMQGIEALEHLLETEPRPDVIVMTAHGTIRSAVEAMRRGAFDYLTKPFDNDELLLQLERATRVRALHAEVDALRGELEARYGFSEIIGASPEMEAVFRVMSKVARVDATLLIFGESGTGKELVARAVHRRSKRSQEPFVAVNCGAIPATLFESELFGHERGAFTDARETRQGSFEQASGGTLFLDEVGELPLEAQAKLLRALQERTIQRVGGKRVIEVDVRILAATHRDLEKDVRDGRFREDLYWRINVVTLNLPPLRDRRRDLPLLIDHIVERFNRELGLAVRTLDPATRQLLLAYHWPGNVRELENTLCRALVLCDGDLVTPEDLPARVRGEVEATSSDDPGGLGEMTLAEAVRRATQRVETSLILSHLARHGGNRSSTAESLGVSRKTLFNKMRQYGLDDGDLEMPEGNEADEG